MQNLAIPKTTIIKMEKHVVQPATVKTFSLLIRKKNSNILIFLILFFVICTSCGNVNNETSGIIGTTDTTETDAESTETDLEVKGLDRAYQALRNKTFSGKSKELKLFYNNGEIIYKPNCETHLIFNNDSMVIVTSIAKDEIRPSIYRIREVTKEEDPNLDEQSKDFIAEFYTPSGELIRLIIPNNLDFANEDPLKQASIRISSKILDYNAVEKSDKALDDLNIDPWGPGIENFILEHSKKFLGERIMQVGIVCYLINDDWSKEYDWSNPVPYHNAEDEAR